MNNEVCGNENCCYNCKGECHATEDYRKACRDDARKRLGIPDPVIQEAIETFGMRAQCLKFLEELGELSTAVSRCLQLDGTEDGEKEDTLIDNLCEELADVEIMSEQVEYELSKTSTRVGYWKTMKLERLRGIVASKTEKDKQSATSEIESASEEIARIKTDIALNSEVAIPEQEDKPVHSEAAKSRIIGWYEKGYDADEIRKKLHVSKAEVEEALRGYNDYDARKGDATDISIEDEIEAVTLRRQGMTTEQIAKQMQKKNYEVSDILSKLPDDENNILRMYSTGSTAADIARDTRTSLTKVRNFLRKFGLTA